MNGRGMKDSLLYCYYFTTILLLLTISDMISCSQNYVKLYCFNIFQKVNLIKISAPTKKIIIFVTTVDVT